MVLTARHVGSHKRNWGFSLIEVLVSLTIIAVILSLALPALGRARSRGRHAKCMATLHDIHIMHATFADQVNRGRFANDFEPDTVVVQWTFGSTLIITDKVLDQTLHWLGPFLRNGWSTRHLEEGSPHCPAAVRFIPFETDQNPQVLPFWSYRYSASMFTAPEVWDTSHPERRSNPDQWRRSVPIHAVRFPDRKVMQFEGGDFHASGKRLGKFSIGQGRTNVLCVDGHAATVDPYAGSTALEVPWPYEPLYMDFTGAMPFSSAADGYLGYDW